MAKNTIILTSYNRTTLLEQAITSVLNQTESDLTLMVIDDNSEKPTRDIIERYASEDDRVVYIQTNRTEEQRKNVTHYAQNINTCLKQLPRDTQYIYYLTCDDYYYPNHIELLSKQLDENPDQMIVFGMQQILRYNDETGIDKKHFVRTNQPIVPIAACQIDHNQIGHRIECLDKLDGWWEEGPEHLGAGDAAFWNKLNEHWPFHRVEAVTNIHRFHKDSIQSLD